MQKQKFYITPDGHKVIATFYKMEVRWKIEGLPFCYFVDNLETFFNKMAAKGWREIEFS